MSQNSHQDRLPQPWQETQVTLDSLFAAGATRVEAAFSPAIGGQGDVLYNNRRYLVTPNDADYKRYAAAMQRANLPYIKNDTILGSDTVVVGELSRDARLLAQVIPSTPSETGLTSEDVFRMVGRAVGELIARSNVMPSVRDLSPRRVMVLRAQAQVLLTPPVEFGSLAGDAKGILLGAMDRELRAYDKLGVGVLLHAYEEGLDGAWRSN